MEEILVSALEPGEKIVWRGGPEKFTALDMTHKSYFIKHCIISLLVAVIIAATYIIMATKNGADIKFFMIAIAAVFAAYKPLIIMVDAGKLAKETIYAATDRRLMVVKDSARHMEYHRILAAGFGTDADGHVSLLCGDKAMKSAPTAWRTYTLLGQGALDEEGGPCESFCFYAVDDVEGLKEILKDYINIS